MSLVVYKDGMLAGDSIIIQNRLVYTAPKVYAYRTSNGNYGAVGYTGNPAVAQELIRAFCSGGIDGFLRGQERMHELLPDNGASVIIAPADMDCIITAAWYEPLMRLPKQPMAIGFDEGISHAQAMFQDPGREWSAAQIVGRVIALQANSAEVYCREPIYQVIPATLTHDHLDRIREEECIHGQFVYMQPSEARS